MGTRVHLCVCLPLSAARSLALPPINLPACLYSLVPPCRSYPSMQGLACLGGFENERREFEWASHLLELDETKYEWGTLYELECETVGHF